MFPFSEKLSIAVVSSLTSYSTAVYFVNALIQDGHDLLVISDTSHSLSKVEVRGVFSLSEILLKNQFKPNVILFIEGGSMQLFPSGLEEIDCLKAWYGIDTHMNYEKHLRIARLFDVTFVAQKEYIAKLLGDGIKQVFWLPLACEPSLYPQSQLERIYDIGYVGSDDAKMHPVRHRMLGSLKTHFPRMWSGKASPHEMGKIYAQSRLVFNKSVNNDLNMRYFEAMGAGAVLLTDPIADNGLEDLFAENEHYITYADEEGLLKAAQILLNNPEQVQRIGRAAQDLVMTKHTYSIRSRELCGILKRSVKLGCPSHLDIFTAFVSMNMLAPALNHLAFYLRIQKISRASHLVNLLISSLISGLALIIIGIDDVKRLLRAR